MTKPKGSVTISQKQMMNCVNHWQILDLMEGRGVPFDDTYGPEEEGFNYFRPHPDYEYTEHVDYDNHTITVTWELK